MTVVMLNVFLSGTKTQNLRETKPPLRFPSANLASAIVISEPSRERPTAVTATYFPYLFISLQKKNKEEDPSLVKAILSCREEERRKKSTNPNSIILRLMRSIANLNLHLFC